MQLVFASCVQILCRTIVHKTLPIISEYFVRAASIMGDSGFPGGFFPYFDSPVTLVPSHIPHEFLGQLLGAIGDSLHPIAASLWNSSLGVMGLGFVLWILSSFKEIIRIPMQVLGIVWDRIFNFSAIDGFETGLTLGFEKETPEEETPDEETPEEETPDEETPEEMPEEQNHEEPIHGKPNAERQQSVEVQDGTDEESRKKQRETVERHQSSEKQATVDVQELKSENLQNSSENSQLRTSARDEEVKQYRETKNKVKHHNESVEKKRKKTKQPENLQEFLRKTSSLYNDLLPAQLLLELAPWEQQNAISKSSSPDINESENSAMKLMDLLTPRLVS